MKLKKTANIVPAKSRAGEKVIKSLEHQAHAGDPDANHYLGYCYSVGLFCRPSPARVARYYLKAAKLGHAEAQFDLGDMLLKRRGVRSQKLALRWFKLAANNGIPEAAFNLGILSEKGSRSRRSALAQAKVWYRRGAQLRDPDCCFRLGRLAEESRRFAEAKKWYSRAYALGSADARYNLALIATAAGGKRNLKKAFKLLKEGARENDPESCTNLGVAYSEGRGTPEQPKKAAICYQKGANLGDVMGLYNLGVCYEEGEGVPKNRKRAFECFLFAAGEGYANAKKALIEWATR